jgi:hypothetical protein
MACLAFRVLVGRARRICVVAAVGVGVVVVAPAARAEGSSGPVVSLSGPAWDSPNQTSSTGVLGLDVTANDTGSGVVSITTTVNGLLYADGPHAQHPCASGGCSLFANGAINLADLHPGDNDVEVDATDTAGKVTPTEWAITIGSGEDPGIQAVEVQDMEREYGIPLSAASSRLALQDAAAPILDQIDAAIGPAASGDDWFAASTGRLEIGVVSSTDPPSGPNVTAAQRILANASLLSQADFVSVANSLADLQSAQAQIDRSLSDLEESGLVSTAVEPSINSVTLTEANGLKANALAEIARVVANSMSATFPSVHVQTEGADRPTVGITDASCGYHHSAITTVPSSSKWTMCDPVLRGGVTVSDNVTQTCTLGFMAKGTGEPAMPGTGAPDNAKVVLTAGHCLFYSDLVSTAPHLPPWYAFNSRGNPRPFQFLTGWFGYEYGTAAPGPVSSQGDFGGIEMTQNADYWQFHSDIYAGASTPVYSIRGDGRRKEGDEVCAVSAIPLGTGQTGPNGPVPNDKANKHATCGHVTKLDVNDPAGRPGSIGYTDVKGLVETSITNVPRGGSGGPIFLNHHGYGLIQGFLHSEHDMMVYQPIKQVESILGVKIAGF